MTPINTHRLRRHHYAKRELMCELVLRVYDVSTFTPAAVKSKVLVPLHKYEKHG